LCAQEVAREEVRVHPVRLGTFSCENPMRKGIRKEGRDVCEKKGRIIRVEKTSSRN